MACPGPAHLPPSLPPGQPAVSKNACSACPSGLAQQCEGQAGGLQTQNKKHPENPTAMAQGEAKLLDRKSRGVRWGKNVLVLE